MMKNRYWRMAGLEDGGPMTAAQERDPGGEYEMMNDEELVLEDGAAGTAAQERRRAYGRAERGTGLFDGFWE